ncbi:membrane metallo-endopeptidase-like 1 [Drosophila sulfurigaster albostrigata]|uniref:membrane metallo-endopeptidase-like 1 n=1 Tax=Drosophila sulfurigaster albostrigata TaxID=89887 RepID=UPI002D21E09D|nr:membrane metallo-endopeptidase-like 1 [Drosophila sulfurigaster albostrigata]
MCKLRLLLHLLCLQLVCGSSQNQTLDYLWHHMNPKIDACVDFYEHACGGWAKAHPSDAYYSQLGQLDYDYKSRLITMLNRKPKTNEPRFVKLLRDNYRSCRRQRIKFKASHFVHFLLKWSESEWKLLTLLKLDHGLELLPHYESSDETEKADIEWLRQITVNWPHKQSGSAAAAEFLPLKRDEFRRLYQQLDLPHGVPRKKLWIKVEQLELQLSQLPHNVSSGKVLSLQQFPDHWLLPLPLQPESSQMLDTHWRHYKQRLPRLLATHSLPVLLPYALLRLLHKLQLRGAPQFTSHECAGQTHELLTHAAVWLLQQESEERQLMTDTMQQLFEQLRQRFALKLQENRNHFGAPAQRFLRDKLQRMRLQVSVLPGGDADEELRLLETHYAPLQLNVSDYFGNLLAILQQLQHWQQQQDALQADGENNNTIAAAAASLHLLQPDGYGSYASPFFMPGRNLVLVPHSLLAPPIYWPKQPALLTQSALGFLIGHEMSHGFTPTDVIYDARGTRGSRQQWRQLRASEHFVRQSRCFRRKYKDMTDEKFCDINGLTLAHEAFVATSSAAVAGNKSMQQLFFLNVAQFFCQLDELQLGQDSDVHGGSRQRINDAVFTSAAFNSAFDCSSPVRDECQLY